MVRIHAKAAAVFVDEFDFSGVSNALAIVIANSLGEVTAFADADATFVEGKPGFTANQNGMFSTASPNFDGEMFINLTAAQRRLGIFPGGAVSGNYGYEGVTDISQSPRVAEMGAVAACNVNWQGTQPLGRAVILDVDTAVAATANGTKYQRGASSATQTIVAVLRLLAAPGGAGNNTLDVTIESDADASAGGETTRLTFTQLDQASVALHEVQSAAGAVTDTWWRVVYTYAGAGSRTFSLVISFYIIPT